MADLVIVLILMVILFAAALYVYRAKKNGRGCIGCPHAQACGKKEGCDCGNR